MNIGRLLLIALLCLPILELYLLMKLVGVLGFVFTFLLLLLAGAVGTTLMRVQGFSTLIRLQEALARGEIPAQEIIGSGLLVLGGLLLLIPGFLSDLLALLCFIPPTRRWLVRRLVEAVPGTPPHGGEFDARVTIEGEYKRED